MLNTDTLLKLKGMVGKQVTLTTDRAEYNNCKLVYVDKHDVTLAYTKYVDRNIRRQYRPAVRVNRTEIVPISWINQIWELQTRF